MLKDEAKSLDGVEIGALDIPPEVEEVLDVLARGMRDNPLTIAAFGNDPEQRRQRFRWFVGGRARALGWGPNMLVARGAEGAIVGVCNTIPPGDRPSRPQLRVLPSLLSNGPGFAGRHWRLGPLAVDAHLQGMGIGSLLMRVFCAQMDAAREDAYLETDKEINIQFFHERFGFEVVGEEEALGVTNWSMLRREGRHQ